MSFKELVYFICFIKFVGRELFMIFFSLLFLVSMGSVVVMRPFHSDIRSSCLLSFSLGNPGWRFYQCHDLFKESSFVLVCFLSRFPVFNFIDYFRSDGYFFSFICSWFTFALISLVSCAGSLG